MSTGAPVPELDLVRLSRWFADVVRDGPAPLSARLIAGGRSNLTYEITDGTSAWILRRPPLATCSRRRTTWPGSTE